MEYCLLDPAKCNELSEIHAYACTMDKRTSFQKKDPFIGKMGCMFSLLKEFSSQNLSPTALSQFYYLAEHVFKTAEVEVQQKLGAIWNLFQEMYKKYKQGGESYKNSISHFCELKRIAVK